MVGNDADSPDSAEDRAAGEYAAVVREMFAPPRAPPPVTEAGARARFARRLSLIHISEPTRPY